MSLMEIIVSALVLAGSSTAALQVWAQVGAAVQQAARTDVQLEAMALQMLASQRWLSTSAPEQSLLSSTAACRFDLEAVRRAADAALPVPEGLQRRWREQEFGQGLWLEIEAPPLQRRQMFTPAAAGWCQSNAPLKQEL